jgi:5-methylcytosine-specific restriction endonuclease McrA
MWINMNWSSLVPMLRAMMTAEGRCLSCGHQFDNDRDIQIEHREPPRCGEDWARHHARNLGLLCQPCNTTKGDRSFADWLDEQEDARISNAGSGGSHGNGGCAPLLPF